MPPKGAAKGKKGSKKKQLDPFLKKEWYVVKVPTSFPSENKKHRVGYSPAKKGSSKKSLDNRTFVVSLGDLQTDPVGTYRPEKNCKKFKFITEDVYGQQLLTQWHGMQITRDQRCSLIRKWYSMIQATVDCKTSDGFVLRVQALAFTKRQITQVKKNCYAKHSQIRVIRARMREIIKNHVSGGDLQATIGKLSRGKIGTDIRKSCQLTFPLKICMIEKVRVLRRPKKDVAKLMEIHDLETTFDLPQEDDESGSEESGSEEEESGSGAENE